jgi:hypothetical protein
MLRRLARTERLLQSTARSAISCARCAPRSTHIHTLAVRINYEQTNDQRGCMHRQGQQTGASTAEAQQGLQAICFADVHKFVRVHILNDPLDEIDIFAQSDELQHRKRCAHTHKIAYQSKQRY